MQVTLIGTEFELDLYQDFINTFLNYQINQTGHMKHAKMIYIHICISLFIILATKI